MNACLKALLMVAMAAAPAAVNAAYTIRFEQVGSDVVATGSGSINLNGLTRGNPTSDYPHVSNNRTFVGASGVGFEYGIFDGAVFDFASSTADEGTGSLVGVSGNKLLLPVSYTSLADLGTSTAIYRNTTLAALRMEAGESYMLNLTNNERSDTFSVEVIGSDDVPAVPEPATWAMMLAGFAMIGAVARYRGRRTATISA